MHVFSILHPVLTFDAFDAFYGDFSTLRGDFAETIALILRLSERGPRARLPSRLAVLGSVASVANEGVVAVVSYDRRRGNLHSGEARTLSGGNGCARVAQRLAQVPLLDDWRRHLLGLDLVLGLLAVRGRARDDGLDLSLATIT